MCLALLRKCGNLCSASIALPNIRGNFAKLHCISWRICTAVRLRPSPNTPKSSADYKTPGRTLFLPFCLMRRIAIGMGGGGGSNVAAPTSAQKKKKKTRKQSLEVFPEGHPSCLLSRDATPELRICAAQIGTSRILSCTERKVVAVPFQVNMVRRGRRTEGLQRAPFRARGGTKNKPHTSLPRSARLEMPTSTLIAVNTSPVEDRLHGSSCSERT